MGWKFAWVTWMENLRESIFWRWSKNGMGGVGNAVSWNLGVGLRCFIEKALLKISQDLQENICTGVST